MAANTRIPNQSGATAPVTLLMLAIIGIIGIATLLFIRGSTVAAHRQYYTRLASSGASSALQYAQEMFDQNPNYSGTKELTILQEHDFRVSISTEVLTTSNDGLAKTIRGIGSVYVRDVSDSSAYTYDVVTKTLYTYATDKTPATFGPVAWYDASDSSTVRENTMPTRTLKSSTITGQPLDSSRSTVEELVAGGQPTLMAWASPDLELDACDPQEFPAIDCASGESKKVTTLLAFNGIDIPPDSNVLSATLNLPITYMSPGNASSYRVCGIFNQAGGNIGPFSNTGEETKAYSETQECARLETKTWPASGTVQVDVARQIRELSRNSLWRLNNSNNSLGFKITHDQGIGQVTVSKDKIELNVTIGDPQTEARASNQIREWLDKSPRGNHARIATDLSNYPNYIANNSFRKRGVQLANNSLLIAEVSPAVKTREQTIIALISTERRPENSASETALLSAQDETSGFNHTLLSSLTTRWGYAARPWSLQNPLDENSASIDCENKQECPTLKPILLSTITSDNGTSLTTSLRASGSEISSVSATAQSQSNESYSKLSIGGRPALAGQTASYSDVTAYEIIVYDRRLSCHEVAALENYLRIKWGLQDSAWNGSCPAQQIPLL